MKKFILFLIFLFLFISPCSAATYYVDNSGCGDCVDYRVVERDCGSGTETNWDTVQEAADNVNGAGDIVYIRSGTYTGDVAWDTNSGSDPNYITFENYTGEAPVLSASGSWAAFMIQNVDWVKLKGLKFDGNLGDSVLYVRGSVGGTDHIYIDDCEVYDVDDYGNIHIKDGGEDWTISYVTIINCTIHDADMEGIYIKRGDHAGAEGSADIQYITIEDCTIYNVGEPVQASRQAPATSGPDNLTFRGIHIYSSGAGSGNTAMLNVGEDSDTILVEDCIIHDDTGGSLSAGGISFYNCNNVTIRNNIIYDLTGDSQSAGVYSSGSSNVYIYHNTIDDMGDDGVYISGGSNILVKNNIISNCTSVAINGGTEDYNVCYNNGSDCSNTHDKNGNPEFINIGEGSEDFHLKANSHAIDAGVDLSSTYELDLDDSSQYDDGRWDCGAYRFKKAGGE